MRRFGTGGGRLATLLMRSSMVAKVVVTLAVMLVIAIAVWFCSDRLKARACELSLQIRTLQDQLVLQNQLLSEYQQLRLEHQALVRNRPALNKLESLCFNPILELVHQSGLALKSANLNGLELLGDYTSLQFFLNQIGLLPEPFDCQELKILQNGDRLQITYLCGIHTLVSK